jgi:chorismate mutase/prephenate dehydratase
MADPIVNDLREQIAAVDRSIVEALNRRLELVARLKRHKDEHGISFVDTAREQWLLDHLARSNTGPLSADGLRAFYGELLALTKREVAG